MSMIKRLFGASSKTVDTTPPVAAAPPRRVDPAPDSRPFQIDNAQAATRRELVRVMTRDALRAAGIPDGWLECLVLLEMGSGGETFVHLRLLVKQWDVRLLKYTIAFQNRLMADITRFDPTARAWLLSISWQYQVGDSCPFMDLPEPSVWQAPAVTAVDLALNNEEPDEVSQDLARLFAIRDADLPPGDGRR
jgi:hypothetical protein